MNPEKTIYEGEITSLIVPCETGYLGVMAGHLPLAANIVSGKIIARNDNEETPKVFNCRDKGFLEVLDNKVTLFLNYTEG
jgi:F0F1-type ATP synthase epsilon subunit